MYADKYASILKISCKIYEMIYVVFILKKLFAEKIVQL